MRIPRVFHSGAKINTELELGRESFGHVVRVLRKTVGDTVLVLDGIGGVYRAEILSIVAENETLRVRVGAEDDQAAPPTLPLGVAVGVPRGDALELAIRQASETGLKWIQPLISERTVARPQGRNKIERWQRIALESAHQCRRHRPLEVFEPVQWSCFLDRDLGDARGWIAVPGADHPTECGLLDGVAGGSSCIVLIGPEGGFSSDEIHEAMGRGYRPLGFPTPVLRTPTAVIYLAAVATLAAP
jgi:16S rRNA (uracil1498-N3)-methyltransferase